MQCEICGSVADRKAEIEGVVLNVCGSCSRSGKEIVGQKPKILKFARLPEEMRSVLMEDFSQVVKIAREKRRLSQEQLASAVKEKLSVIKRIENGWKPALQTARKIENFLGVRLVETPV